MIDEPNTNDNRNYNYSGQSFENRSEFKVICDWISQNSKVIDLACGNGSLMNLLKDKNVQVEGIDTSVSGVEFCLQNGLKAKVGEIDKKETYSEYLDKQFDFAICNVTLQMVMYPEILLAEMKRISKNQIITFPNFGYYGNRLEMFFKGKMPETMLFGYKWHNTGHIHQLSVLDFKNYCKDNDWQIIKEDYIGNKNLVSLNSNLFSLIAIFLIK